MSNHSRATVLATGKEANKPPKKARAQRGFRPPRRKVIDGIVYRLNPTKGWRKEARVV